MLLPSYLQQDVSDPKLNCRVTVMTASQYVEALAQGSEVLLECLPYRIGEKSVDAMAI